MRHISRHRLVAVRPLSRRVVTDALNPARSRRQSLTLSLGSRFSFLTYRGYVTEAPHGDRRHPETSGEPIYEHTAQGALAGLKGDIVEVGSQAAPGDTLTVETSAALTEGAPFFEVRVFVAVVP